MPNLMAEAAFADRAYQQHADSLAINPAFFNKYAHPVHEWDWRQFGAKRLGAVAGCQLLDYGCGAGEEAVYWARLGAKVTAIDISPIGIELTQARARFNGVTVDARQMRCDPTSFPNESFDVVHGFGILHHVGLEAGLAEVRRLLVPGGRGLFFEHMGNVSWVERLKPRESHTEDERPLRWTDLQCASGFSVFETTPFHLLHRLRHYLPMTRGDWAKRMDAALLTRVPALRTFASGVVIYLER